MGTVSSFLLAASLLPCAEQLSWATRLCLASDPERGSAAVQTPPPPKLFHQVFGHSNKTLTNEEESLFWLSFRPGLAGSITLNLKQRRGTGTYDSWEAETEGKGLGQDVVPMGTSPGTHACDQVPPPNSPLSRVIL